MLSRGHALSLDLSGISWGKSDINSKEKDRKSFKIKTKKSYGIAVHDWNLIKPKFNYSNRIIFNQFKKN